MDNVYDFIDSTIAQLRRAFFTPQVNEIISVTISIEIPGLDFSNDEYITLVGNNKVWGHIRQEVNWSEDGF